MQGPAFGWKHQPVQWVLCLWMKPSMSGAKVQGSSFWFMGMNVISSRGTEPTSPRKTGPQRVQSFSSA